MFTALRKITLIGATFLVSACGATFDYDALRNHQDDSANFAAELGKAYKKFALTEVDQMHDWIDGAHFGEKAMMAFNHRAPKPEAVENWWLTKDQKPEFEGARNRLVRILGRRSKNQLPKVAAQAQVNFDCWIEQQEENWQVGHIAKCRDQFYAAVERLEDVAALARSQYRTVSTKPLIKQTLFSPSGINETRTYTLYFAFDNSAIDGEAAGQIDRVVENYRAGAPVTIVLAGHTDKSGKKTYNLNLSRLRAEAVRRTLIERGIPVQLIAAHAFGETRSKIPTVDGMKEPLNRRVEITVGPAPAL